MTASPTCLCPMEKRWRGVFPAVTTRFTSDFALDLDAMRRHFTAQLDAGVHGLVVCGSLGEASTLAPEEKIDVLRLAIEVGGGRVPVLCGVQERRTLEACRFVETAQATGADGFMLLPPMLYTADRRETVAYLRSVAAATDRPIMLYNNPVSYRIDVTPEMLEEVADEPKFVAIKESSDDVRRVTEIQRRLGERYQVFTGVDNLALESLLAGAVGWVAGLVCAFPRETVALYDMARSGRLEEARALYRWFRPLLDLDVSTRLVQNIKLAEAMVGVGADHVRPPRLPLAGEERARVAAVVQAALETRPALDPLIAA